MADLLNPQLPAPPSPLPAAPTPPPALHPQPPKMPAALGAGPAAKPNLGTAAPWLNQQAHNLGSGVADTVSHLGNQIGSGIDNLRYNATTAATQSTPPLVASGLTAKLPQGIRGPVEGALGFAQKGLQNNPQMTATLAGSLAPGVVNPLLGSGLGLPMMAGLHGMLAGGESAAATNTLFRPLLNRIGM